MLLGAMNHPRRKVVDEIRWIGEMGLDFIDLTLEPPAAASWNIDAREVVRELERQGLAIVGHTAYYLPLGHPFEEVRKGAVEELRRCMQVFSDIGADCMNIHPDAAAPMQDPDFWYGRNLCSLSELLEDSRRLGVRLMVENLPVKFNTPEQISKLLDPMPELGLHLDIGHTNLVPYGTCTFEPVLARYADRLCHVHLHDNKGGTDDLHLPIGAGTMEVERYVAALKASGYDGTITLEVFTPDQEYLRYSAEKLRKFWKGLPAPAQRRVPCGGGVAGG